jgi:hypothetical protein
LYDKNRPRSCAGSGLLTRSAKKVVINPFEEGVELCGQVHTMATFFTQSGKRWDKLREKLVALNAPTNKIRIVKGDTRIAARYDS